MQLLALNWYQVSIPASKVVNTPLGIIPIGEKVLIELVAESASGWAEVPAIDMNGFALTDLSSTRNDFYQTFPTFFKSNPGLDLNSLENILLTFPASMAARCAISIAALDLKHKLEKTWIGHSWNCHQTNIKCCLVLSGISDLHNLSDEINLALSKGFNNFKIKVSSDIEFYEAVKLIGRMGAEVENIILDCNQSLSLEAEKITLPPRVWLEEPTKVIDNFMKHRRQILLDESISDYRTIEEIINQNNCGGITLKIGRFPNISSVRQAISLIAGRGTHARISGTFDSGIGRATNLLIAASINTALPHDVSPPLTYLESDLLKSPLKTNGLGEVPLQMGPGWGIEVDRNAIEKYLIKMESLRLS